MCGRCLAVWVTGCPFAGSDADRPSRLTVARDGEFSFIIHTRELPFEPPHMHVSFGGDEVRIELGGGTQPKRAAPKRLAYPQCLVPQLSS